MCGQGPLKRSNFPLQVCYPLVPNTTKPGPTYFLVEIGGAELQDPTRILVSTQAGIYLLTDSREHSSSMSPGSMDASKKIPCIVNFMRRGSLAKQTQMALLSSLSSTKRLSALQAQACIGGNWKGSYEFHSGLFHVFLWYVIFLPFFRDSPLWRSTYSLRNV